MWALKTLSLASLFVLCLCVACTGPSPGSPGAEEETGIEAVEKSQARERRAELRELHRRQGRRVCEEGEHGTRWQEACNTCWCDHGVRACTKARCVDRPREEHLNGLEERLRARESRAEQ